MGAVDAALEGKGRVAQGRGGGVEVVEFLELRRLGNGASADAGGVGGRGLGGGGDRDAQDSQCRTGEQRQGGTGRAQR